MLFSKAGADQARRMMAATTPALRVTYRGQLAAAEETWHMVIAELDTTPDAERQMPRVRANLAEVLLDQWRLSEAETIYRDLLDACPAMTPRARAHHGRVRCGLARALSRQGRTTEAEVLFRDALSVLAADPENERDLADAESTFATALTESGHAAGAEERLGRALAVFDRLAAHWSAVKARGELARSLVGQVRFAEAEIAARDAVQRLERLGGAEHAAARARVPLGQALLGLGRTEESRVVTLEALQVIEALSGNEVEAAWLRDGLGA